MSWTKSFLSLAAAMAVLVLVPQALPAAAAAGDAHAGGFDWLLWTARILNALIFFGVILYFAAPVVGKLLRDRQSEIHRELEEAKAALAEARRQKKEAESTLARLEEERAQIREKAAEEARAEKERILEEAERGAERMLAMADQQIESALREARAELRRYAAEVSTSLAADMIREEIGAEDRERLFREGVRSLEVES